ncbi:MAG: ribbon-helix-helix domain-containing protein [Clostridia bacterium]|nr:ribbon-helix-helix domain-containing protein [Clostridia bacterium]
MPKGRPTNNPKKHEIRIRMSDEDIEILKHCCKITGKNQSEIIRQGIREIYAKVKK